MSDSVQNSKDALRDEEVVGTVKADLQQKLESEKGFDLVLDSSLLGTAVEAEASDKLVKGSAVVSDTSVASDIPEAIVADALTSTRDGEGAPAFTGEEAAEYAATVTVTPDEKEAFLKAITFDTRFELPFSVFGGKIKGIIRNRSLSEHNVLVAYLMALVASQQIRTEDEYQQQLRALTLAAQVKQLGQDEFEELKEPLAPQGSGEVPGWLSRYQYWLERDGRGLGVTRAVFREIQKFEGKYWSMLRQAENENFWSTAEST